MTLTINLTPEMEARLRAEAKAKGTDEAGAVLEWIAKLPEAKPKTGKELVASLRQIEGPSVFARFPDDADTLAKRLREQAEQRDWDAS